jgi:hypothetical protein
MPGPWETDGGKWTCCGEARVLAASSATSVTKVSEVIFSMKASRGEDPDAFSHEPARPYSGIMARTARTDNGESAARRSLRPV